MHFAAEVTIGQVLIVFCLAMFWIAVRVTFVRNVIDFKGTWRRHQKNNRPIAREYVVRRRYWGGTEDAG